MPLYSYICSHNHETEKFFHMKDAKEAVPCDECQCVAWRDYSRIRFSPPRCTGEQESMALGVQPGQEDDYMQDAAAKGVEVNYRNNGSTAVFRDEKAKRAYMKAYGYEYKPRVGAKEL